LLQCNSNNFAASFSKGESQHTSSAGNTISTGKAGASPPVLLELSKRLVGSPNSYGSTLKDWQSIRNREHRRCPGSFSEKTMRELMITEIDNYSWLDYLWEAGDDTKANQRLHMGISGKG